jgi:hypothetical protein
LLDTHAQKTALRLGVAVDAVRKEFSKVQGSGFRAQGSETSEETLNSEPETLNRPSNNELHLLKLLFVHEELAAWLAAHLALNWIAHPHVRQIVDSRLAAAEHGTWHSLAEFLDACESPEQRSLITGAVADARALPNSPTQLADVTLKLRNQFLDLRIAALTNQISLPETADAEKVRLLHEQQQLKQQKRAPLESLHQ